MEKLMFLFAIGCLIFSFGVLLYVTYWNKQYDDVVDAIDAEYVVVEDTDVYH